MNLSEYIVEIKTKPRDDGKLEFLNLYGEKLQFHQLTKPLFMYERSRRHYIVHKAVKGSIGIMTKPLFDELLQENTYLINKAVFKLFQDKQDKSLDSCYL